MNLKNIPSNINKITHIKDLQESHLKECKHVFYTDFPRNHMNVTNIKRKDILEFVNNLKRQSDASVVMIEHSDGVKTIEIKP